MLHTVCKILLTILLKAFFWHRTFGRENFPRGGALIACNHQSYMDPTVIGTSAPEKPVYMARRSLVKGSLLRWLFKEWNTVLITPGEPELSTIRKILKRLEIGEKVLIFPEGQRSYDGNLQPAKSGLGLIVARARVPVIPAYVYGTYNAMPRGRSLILPAKIIVAFGKPIYFDQILKSDKNKKEIYREISETVMAKIADLKTFCLSKL